MSAPVNSRVIVPPARIGFIGLGQMGGPMARNLARAGYGLVAHDVDRDALKRACEMISVEAGESLWAMASRCEAVITMLPDGETVRAVVLGPGGTGDCLLAGFSRGGILVDMSSSSPLATRELGARLAERGVAMLDAPVSGGVRKAADATLSIMVGGDAQSIARCRPFLETMGSRIFMTGPLGSGHAMKALNNSGFSLDLMVKDLNTALEVARSTGSPARLAEACLEAWTEAQATLGPGLDHTAVVRYWEKLAGTELGKKHD